MCSPDLPSLQSISLLSPRTRNNITIMAMNISTFTLPANQYNIFTLKVVWKALRRATNRRITRLLSALSATCILHLPPKMFQTAYRQLCQLDLGINLQVLAFIAQAFESMGNMQKKIRVYSDFFHSQLKGPILNCIKKGLKTVEHRLSPQTRDGCSACPTDGDHSDSDWLNLNQATH